ncbi:MAG: Na/Pi cotransporter family protein [Candidatus Omnitrophota bacterium]
MIMKDLIFGLIGGLGFFFFGMKIMSEGLKKIAGERLKKILHMATSIPIVGVLVGAGITCLIQSSSATTVMVVGFVNAGLLLLKQAICVIMGANIGTTFTAWLVSSMAVFKISHYALPAVGLGFTLTQIGKTRKMRFWGEVILGFGLLFIGLSFMKDTFIPIKNSQYIKEVFVTLGNNPLLGVLVGIIFTVLLQSSSATIAIVQVLAFNGLISLPTAIPIILGDNIGTTITAQLAALGTNLTARRAAMSHTLFNTIGVAYMMVLVMLGLFVKFIRFIIPGDITTANIMFYIAVSHSAFNVVNTIIFLPFIGFLEKASIWLVPKKKGAIEMGAQYLEKHLLDTPTIALEQVRKETVRMLSLAKDAVSSAAQSFIDNDKKGIRSIPNLEEAVDSLQSEITQYLVELSQRTLAHEESEELPVLIHNVNDIERIGDHSENIAELVELRSDEKLSFSDEAQKDLILMWEELQNMIKETQTALKNNDSIIAEKVVKEREQNINKYQCDLKKKHVDRLSNGVCDLKTGIVFIDFVDNLEKVGDHLANIAQGILGSMRWEGYREETPK